MERAAIEEAAGVPVSRETFVRLERFVEQFRKWAPSINLVAPSTLPLVWTRHVLDSAQLLRLAPGARRWIDLGSGGGFPGAVIAILLSETAGAKVQLVESNAKKVAFLRTALGMAGVPARIEQARIENCASREDEFDVVTARALASLDKLLHLAAPWLERGAFALFHKGRDYRREVEESRDAWDFDLLEHASVADPESVVLEIRKLRRRNHG